MLKEKNKLTGTARYSSVNALGGGEQSRRDDLESIAYVILYFLRGRLPWQGIRVANKVDRYKKIYEKKKNTTSKELCAGFPREFETFVNYVKHLQFTEVPDYDYLRQLLKNILVKIKTPIDYYYDWDEENPHIDKNNIIYKHNYNIEYNGKNEWLIRKNIFNNRSNRRSKEGHSIYSKQVFSIIFH